MKNSKRFLTLSILFSVAVMFSMLAVSASVVSTSQTYVSTDNSLEIEAKYKTTSSNKITFNGNGGKIGSKKTVAINIKKGTKIKKFPTTPKRTGYSFKGWFTKKSGGFKISTNTKVSKKSTYYAQWTKKANSRVLTTEEKKLIGTWQYTMYNTYPTSSYTHHYYLFRTDGTFSYERSGEFTKIGNYKVSGGKITFTNILWRDSSKKIGDHPNNVAEYQFVKGSNSKEQLRIAYPYSDRNYLSIDLALRWDKIK